MTCHGPLCEKTTSSTKPEVAETALEPSTVPLQNYSPVDADATCQPGAEGRLRSPTTFVWAAAGHIVLPPSGWYLVTSPL